MSDGTPTFFDRRLPSKEVATAIDEMRTSLRTRRRAYIRRWQLGGVGLVVAGTVFWPWIVHLEDGMWFPTGALSVLAFGLGILCLLPDKFPAGHPRLTGKLDFVATLLERLGPELNPRTRVALRVDLGMYQEYTKLERQAKSGGGRQKHYYGDRWLRLVVRLADGSVVRILRHMGTKTKAGRGVQRERRRLSLQIAPNPKLYRPLEETADLDRALASAVKTIFAKNTLEGFEVYARPSGDRIDIKAFQDDIDITADETMALLEAALQQLQTRRTSRGAYR